MKIIRVIIAIILTAFAVATSYAVTITPSGNTVTVAVTTGPKGDTGPIGPQGIQGPAGPQGSAGPAGPQGPQGIAGLSLNWRGDWAGSPTGYVNNDAVYRNGSSYRAINYSSGVDPATDTTYAHWYPVSIKGATGATGAAGATGATGPAGPQGAKGDKGDIGSTGPAGAQGPQGIQGPTGATGAPGATGATGATGPTGPAGPKGDKGDTGAAGAGVPAGGTTGQVLSKINGTDYNTQWVNQSGGLPTDSPTVTTKITAPLFESNASDGTHYIKPYNTTAYSGTCTKGMVQTVGTPAALQVCTADGTWAAAGTGGGTWGTITGTLTDQTDLNSALGLKAPKASPTFTGTVTLPITGSGNQCVRVSSTGVVSGTGSDCGTTSGTIGGSTGSTDNAVLVASGTGGATIKATPVIIATDGSTITTAKIAASADAHLLRAAPDLTGAGFMGPSTGTTTPYYLQLPATAPTAGQVLVMGTPTTGTVNGVTANIIPVTGGANGTSVPLTDSVSTTSSTTAASATAVKTAYDLAATKGVGTVTPSTTDTFTNKAYDTAGTGNVLKINGTQVTDKTGTGKVVLDTSPTLVTPNIGAATATSIVATGLVDGTAPTALTTVNDYVLGSTYKTNYTFNNYATAPQTIVYRLPAPVPGRTECVRNYTGKTNVLQVQALASTYIDMDGANSASGGYVISGGSLGDAACFVGVDANHWVMYAGKGTWTLH